MVLQIYYHDFFDLANFAAFLDHTKEKKKNADVSKNDGQLQVNFYIFREFMLEAISRSNFAALDLLPVKSKIFTTAATQHNFNTKEFVA